MKGAEVFVMGMLGGMRVLAVDDEPLVLFSVVDELEDAGAEVVDATDGLTALELLENGLVIDALVTDVRMPRMDGWTLAERARELWPDLAVLYVTGWSEAPPRLVPGSRLIPKPFLPSSIPAAVAALIPTRPKLAPQ